MEKFIMLLIYCLSLFNISAQEIVKWETPFYQDALDSMGLICRLPVGFQRTALFDCHEDNRKLDLITGCIMNAMVSEDGQCILSLPIYRPLSTKEMEHIDSLFPQFKEGRLPGHLANSKQSILSAYGKQVESRWKDYIRYYSDEEAQPKFNADTAITFTIELDSNIRYKGKYGNLDVLFVTKEGRGFINYYLYYTDEAKKDIARRRKDLEVLFWYKEL